MSVNLGLLLLRVLFGGAIAAHGAQKLFGWFNGGGLSGTGAAFEAMGFRPGKTFALIAGLGEFGGGVLLILGLLTPLGAAGILAGMLVAMFTAHVGRGFFAMEGGIELPFLYAAAALGIAITGAGAISLDAAWGLAFVNRPGFVLGALALGVIGAVVSLSVRRRPPAAGEEAPPAGGRRAA